MLWCAKDQQRLLKQNMHTGIMEEFIRIVFMYCLQQWWTKIGPDLELPKIISTDLVDIYLDGPQKLHFFKNGVSVGVLFTTTISFGKSWSC